MFQADNLPKAKKYEGGRSYWLKFHARMVLSRICKLEKKMKNNTQKMRAFQFDRISPFFFT